MKISQLQTFVAIVETGSFSAGARRQKMSQPAATFQIQALEESLGIKLVDRSSKALLLTEAGKVLFEYGKKIIDEVESLENKLQGLSETIKGDFKIGASTIPGEFIVPLLLGRFKNEYPEARPYLEVTDTESVIERVASGDFDIGIVGARVENKRLSFKPFVQDELIIIAHPGFEPDRGSMKIADLLTEPFIMREVGSGTRLVFERELESLGLHVKDIKIAMELSSAEAVLTAVEAGLGLSVASRWAANNALQLGKVKELPVMGFPIVRELFVVTPTSRIISTVSERFLLVLDDFKVGWRK